MHVRSLPALVLVMKTSPICATATSHSNNRDATICTAWTTWTCFRHHRIRMEAPHSTRRSPAGSRGCHWHTFTEGGLTAAAAPAGDLASDARSHDHTVGRPRSRAREPLLRRRVRKPWQRSQRDDADACAAVVRELSARPHPAARVAWTARCACRYTAWPVLWS